MQTLIPGFRPENIDSAPRHVWLLALIGLAGCVSVDLVGRLFLHEMIFIIIAPLLFLTKLQQPAPRNTATPILVFALFWLAAQVATDINQEIPSVDYLRGWAKIMLFILSIWTLNRLFRLDSRLAFGFLAFSGLAAAIRAYNEYAEIEGFIIAWKFGIGYGILCMLLGIICWQTARRDFVPERSIRLLALILGALGLISFFLNARSLAGLSILSSAVLFIYCSNSRISLSRQRIFMGMILLLGLASIFNSIYVSLASNGSLGERAYEKYEMSASDDSTLLGVLIGGRSESLVAWEAIKNSPLLGHGSWAKDYYYTRLAAEIRKSMVSDLEKADFREDVNDGLIPSHSFLFGAWVESGITGALFWASIVLWNLFFVIPLAWRRGNSFGIAALTLSMFLCWDILFSPFGAGARVDTACTIALLLQCTEQY